MKKLYLFFILAVWVMSAPLFVSAQNDLTLELVFDRYRSETSWELTDAGGNVVDNGGNYGPDFPSNGAYPHPPIAITNLPDGEYSFTIFDEWGDGMCCQYGNGSYTLIQDSDDVIIVTGGAFGSSESTTFTLPYTAPASGCTDPEAVNFDPEAVADDGSCEYLTSPISINLVPFATGLNNPLAMKHAGDERMFVCEQNTAQVRILDANGDIIGTFINISSIVNSSGSERGLLGIAFHPNYSENGYFYLNYTNLQGHSEVRRYTVSASDPNVADPNSGHLIIRVNQPFSNHNAGDMEFGPDGYLYLPMGDGGSGGDPQNHSQNPQSLLGKMLRLDVDGDDFPDDPLKNYAIPPDNPFVNDASVLDEIWALGLRNAWQISFDRETGDLWISDVGQNLYEEVNMQPASSPGGENYGWRCYEGFNPYNLSGCQSAENYDFPVFEFAQNQYNWCSVTGGNVYRGSDYPLLNGRYLVTDYCGPTFYTIRQNALGNWVAELVNSQFTGFSGFVAFGEDINGELYAVRLTNGTIYRIEEPCSEFIPAIAEEGNILTSSPGESYQWLFNGQLIDGATDQVYVADEPGSYSVVVDAGNGCVVQSEQVQVIVSSVAELAPVFDELRLFPNPSRGVFTLDVKVSEPGMVNVDILDGTGRVVKQYPIGQVVDRVQEALDLSGLGHGVYYARIQFNNQTETRRLVIIK